ncbi:MAG TPA: hypothetical protein VN228_10650 [Pyrinomonadaceae bacterium]|nr:hypothetical protein [Pyrinomonadaceae bacterium]
MRTSLKILLALCAAAALAAARGPAGGLEVVSFGWKYEGYAQAEVVRSKRSGHTLSVKRGTDYFFKYRAAATVRNDGAKAVRAVEWAYVFAEPEGGRELKRYRLQSKQTIEPGATATLTRDVSIKPDEESRHLTTGRQQVVVTRVEYADGSVWKGEKP